jgi:E3 ubiquitin-protein ligase BOI-like protein
MYRSTQASEMWKALAEQRQKQIRLITSAAEDKAGKQLKAKDDEIKHITCLNWDLRERLRNLQKEAQMWRDVARSKEAAALALRGDLQRALEAQAVRGRGVNRAIDDASSCCWGDNQAVPSVGTCKGCGQGNAMELLLPCRHLSACALCAAIVQACPACGCAKTGSIRVNFS